MGNALHGCGVAKSLKASFDEVLQAGERADFERMIAAIQKVLATG